MKKVCALALALIMGSAFIASAAWAQTSYGSREGRFQFGAVFPSVFFGNKNIDAMLSGAIEGDYFIIENLSIGFRFEDATDFKLGDAPHNVLSMTMQVRYIFDVDDDWKAYLGLGGGVALLGKDSWAGDIRAVNVGGYYQFNDHLSIGVDANMHVFVRSNTAFAFSLGPSFHWMF